MKNIEIEHISLCKYINCEIKSLIFSDAVELRAKRSLGLGLPDQLVGRDREIGILSESISTLISDKSSATFYLAGQPGTGKTATVRHSIRLVSLLRVLL